MTDRPPTGGPSWAPPPVVAPPAAGRRWLPLVLVGGVGAVAGGVGAAVLVSAGYEQYALTCGGRVKPYSVEVRTDLD